MTALHKIGTLWIGERLSFLEHLCLKSFVDAGHEVTLFSYAPVDYVPDGVRVDDARAIFDDDEFIIHKERGSPALHADLFRVKLVRNTDLTWVDCDAYCLKPFVKTSDYLFGFDGPRYVANGVLGAPRTSEALRLLDAFLSTKGAALPWWTAEESDAHLSEFGHFDFADMTWGSTGPAALTWFLNLTGEIDHALPKDVLYPIPSLHKQMVFRRPFMTEKHITENTISVHFYGTLMRQLLARREVHKGSFIAHLARRHDVPLPGKDD